MQKIAKYPLLIAADLEKGPGNKINRATLFPPAMSIGATGSEELAYKMGKITAIEAKAVGVHMTYAPVVDVNSNPENPIINVRSFGEDPEQVARLATAFIKGCQENGLISTAKHFPGHGDTVRDSHVELPVIKGNRERLEAVELYPFKRAIKAGVMAVMTSHLWVPSLDPTPDLPAPLSHPIITELLRKDLGFGGIIITDALEMGGITTLFSQVQAAIKSLQAGVDVLLIPLEIDAVIPALVQAVRDGRIPETRINASVRKILETKVRLKLHKQRLVRMELLDRVIASQPHVDLAKFTYERSITLVKNEGCSIPIPCKRGKLAIFSLSSDPGGYFAGQTFVRAVRARCPKTFSFYADAFTGDEFIQEAIANIQDVDVIVLALFSRLASSKGSVDIDQRHIKLVKDLSACTIPVVVVSFGSPYFLRHFPEVDTYMCTYSPASQAQRAAAEAILGEIDITGKLPISIPEMFLVGHGLQVEAAHKDSDKKQH
jgi:beta-glucosidase-like glycosyl hydrolase